MDELGKMLGGQGPVFLGDARDIGAAVVNPDVLGGVALGEENDVGLGAGAIGGKGAPGQAQDGMEVTVLRKNFENFPGLIGKETAKPNKTKRTNVKAKRSSSQGAAITPDIADPADVEENGSGDIDVKTELSGRELTFLKLHLLEGIDQINALKLAGYRSTQEKYLQYLAKKILVRYESQAGDHRKIFRSLGGGETAVAQGLLKLATTARSEQVRLNAWTVIAKCLGLQKDTIDIATGISIVINVARQAETEPGPGGGRPALIPQEQHKQVQSAITITK
jgi:hypothetical protein